MSTTYKWDREEVDAETGDILDHRHADRLADLEPGVDTPSTFFRIALVRDQYTRGMTHDRQWAYVVDSMLPAAFRDAADNEGAPVPKRFHAEIAAVAARFGLGDHRAPEPTE